MDKPFRSLGSFFAIVICSTLLGLSGCEDPGSVGSELSDSNADVVTDTIFVDDMQTQEYTSYSGELSFFSAGHYNDPLFGELETTAFAKPGLPASGDSIEADANMLMRVILEEGQAYGDTMATQEFSIYEVDELWRARALKLDDDIQINTEEKVGSFSVGDEDSLDVELSQEWVDEYRQFTDTTDADSAYRYNFYGLAMVSDNDNKIIPLDASDTRFVIENPESDTFDVSTSQWGYTLQHGQENNVPEGSAPFYSTLESVVNFSSLGVEDLDLQASAFSRAELVLHQNTSVMEQSLQSEPTSVQRPPESTVYLHFVDSTGVPDNIDPGGQVDDINKIEGEYSASDGTYRFGITNLVDRIIQAGLPEGRQFYITSPNSGVIRSGLVYTDSDQVPEDKRPQIIITSLKNNSN